MKNVALFLILLIAGIAVYIILAEPEWLEDIVGKESGPVAEEPISPEPPSAPRESAPSAPSPTPTASVKAKLTLPAIEMDLFLSGEPAEPGTTVEIDPGTVVVSGFDGSGFAHQVLSIDANSEQTISLKRRETSVADTWPTFQGNPSRTGHVDAPARDAFTRVWQKDLGDEVQSSPIIVGDKVFFSSEKRLINAVDLNTGEVLWSHGAIGSAVSPIATDRYIFIGNDLGNFEGYRLDNGKKRGETGLGSYPTSLALISEEAFLATTRGRQVYSIKTKRRFTGRLPLKLNWEIDLPELGDADAAPIIDGNKAIFQAQGEALIAIDLESGRKLWTAGETVAVQAQTAQIQTSIADPDAFLTPTPAAANGMVYAVMGKDLAAIDIATGKPHWRTPIKAKVTSSVSLAYGMVYVGCVDGAIRAYSTHQGELVYSTPLSGDPVWASPVVFGGRLLVGTKLGKLVLLHAFTGKKVAEDLSLSGAGIESTPAVAGDRIFAVNAKGVMACYR